MNGERTGKIEERKEERRGIGGEERREGEGEGESGE